MAYTPPRTVAPDDTYPASQWNTEVRDNLNDLHVRLRIAGTAPATPTAGQMWVDTSGAQNILKVYDGSNWIGIGYDPGGAAAGNVLKVNSGLTGYEFGAAGMKRAIGTGYQYLPAGPSVGLTVTSGSSADALGSYVEFSASAPGDLLVLGVVLDGAPNSNRSYWEAQIATGGAGSEVVRGRFRHGQARSTLTDRMDTGGERDPAPTFIASGERIAVAVADSGTAMTLSLSLRYILLSDLEDF